MRQKIKPGTSVALIMYVELRLGKILGIRDQKDTEERITRLSVVPKSSEATLERPNIFSYDKVQPLINDWFRFLQSSEEKLNVAKFAVRTQLSHSYLSLLFSGKRILSEKALKKLSPHLNMKEEELLYLDILRKLEGSKSHEEKAEAFEIAQKLKAYQLENPESTNTYLYLSQWLNVAIREMTRLKSFKADPTWIQKKLNFPATIKNISTSLNFLISNELIISDENGSYKASVRDFHCSDKIFKMALINYHQNMLKLAHDAQTSMSDIEDRAVYGITMSLTEKKYQMILNVLKDAQAKMNQIENLPDDGAEIVTQVEMAVFNLAQAETKKGDKE